MPNKFIFSSLFVLWLSLLTVKAQTTPIVLQNFIKEVSDKKNDCEYFYSNYTTAKDCEHSNSIQLVKAQIDGMRDFLKDDADVSKNIKYVAYNNIPTQQKPEILISSDRLKDVYISFYKEKPFVYFLLNGTKLESFSTMNKGGKISFLNYCNK